MKSLEKNQLNDVQKSFDHYVYMYLVVKVAVYCKLDTFRSSCIPSAANIWNSLPEYIRNQNSLDSLKRALDSLK